MNKIINLSSVLFLILNFNCVFAAEEKSVEPADNDGVVAFNSGHYKEAEDYFLLKLKEPNAKNEALNYLSKIALEKGDAETAIKYIEQALPIEPTNAEELLLSGDIYCNQAQRSSIFSAIKLAKKCVGQYDAAVNIDPENITALVSATKYYLSAPSIVGGSTKKGSELLERLSHLSPEDADTCKLQLLDKEADASKAITLADELSKKGFKSAENQYEVALYYRTKKLYSKSKALLEPLLTWKQTQKNKWFLNDSLLQLGEIFLIEGTDPAQGVKLIESYKQKNSNPHDIHYFWSTWSLAKGYKTLGEKDRYDALVKSIKSEDYKQNSAFAKEFEANI